LPSVALHGVRSSFGVHCPGAGTQPRLHPSTVKCVFCLWVCAHTPTPAAFFSQPAVVHRLPSLSLHAVLSSFAVQRPVAGTQPRLHSSTVQSVFCLWVCRHTPTPAAFFSHPAVVHRLPSLSVHGVLSSFAVQRPVAGTQPRLHSFTVQSVFCLWVCRHPPSSAVFFSQPAVVHRLPSLSVHGVLSSFAVQRPVAGTQPRLHSSTVQSVFCLCVWRHTPTPAAFFSHPAVVHRLPSLSVHGVLSSFAVHSLAPRAALPLYSFTVQSVFCVCVCRHTPTPAAFFSQPAVVHRL